MEHVGGKEFTATLRREPKFYLPSVAIDDVFYIKIGLEDSVFCGRMAAQVCLVCPFGPHLC